MQESFVLRVKRGIKKVAALSAGAAMLGATLTGAYAQASSLDLANYPAPFVVGGKYDSSNVLVVGSNAAASDTLGLTDIATNLQFESKECRPSSGGTVSVAGGSSEDVPIGKNIASTNEHDSELDDGDISTLIDTTINFVSSDYDVSEVVELGLSKNVSVHSSLTGSDDDYEDRVVMEADIDSIKYYYKFDETIQLNTSSSTDTLDIDFLGKPIKIKSIDSATKFTALVGDEFFLGIDESVTVSGKQVTLKDVGSGGAIVVDVDGVSETISNGVTKTVNGIEINNDQQFYTDTKAERSATLFVGEDASEAYSDGDAYIGEDDSDPKWVWDIGNLHTKLSTTVHNTATAEINATGPFIGVENDWRYRDGADADAIEVGQCLDLPNNYVSICLDSLSVSDDAYMRLTISYEENVDLASDARVVGFPTSVNAIKIESSVKDGLKIKDGKLLGSAADNITRDIKTDKVYLALRGTGEFIQYQALVFYRDVEQVYANSASKLQYAGNISFDPASAYNTTSWMEINYKDTKDTNIVFDVGTAIAKGMNLTLNIVGDTDSELPNAQDDLIIQFKNSSTTITALGDTKSSEEAGELQWLGGAKLSINNLGTKDEDHRTMYGIIVRDPKSNGASDEVVLDIPADQVQANVVVKGSSATVSGSSNEVCTVASITPRTLLDTEVTNPQSFNLILVGGPCANPLVETVFGVSCSGWELSEGEALVRLANNGNKVAMVVAGTTALDTRRAAKAVSQSDRYTFSGAEAIVKGTTLNDISVE